MSLQKQINMLRKVTRPQTKYVDTVQAPTVITTTSTITQLVTITNGMDENSFIGNRVILKSILMRMAVTVNVTSMQNLLRIALVQDKQSNGGTPSVTDIFATSSFLSPLNDDNSKRFKILHDTTFAVGAASDQIVIDKWYRKLKIAQKNVNGTIETNDIYLVQISDQATNGPSVQWYSRVRYTNAQ